MKKALSLLILISLLLIPICAKSQGNNQSYKKTKNGSFDSYWNFSFQMGGTSLYGDNTHDILDTKFNAGIIGGYTFKPYLGVDVKLSSGKLKGIIQEWKVANTNYLEANANVVFEPINLFIDYKRNRFCALKLNAGVGQIYAKTRLTDTDEGTTRTRERKAIFEMPLGATASFRLTNYFFLYFNYTYTFVDSGYLDGWNTDYTKDCFSTFNVGLQIKIKSFMKTYGGSLRVRLYK